MKRFNAVVAINGKISAGKDTFARALMRALSRRGFEVRIIHFGDPLKDDIEHVFGLTHDELYTQAGKASPYKYNPKILNRDILQIFGTDIARKIDNNIWIRKTFWYIEQFLTSPKKKSQKKAYRGRVVLIPDMRFKNEFDAIKKMRVEGLDHLKTYTVKIVRNDGYKPGNQQHESEWGLDPYPYFKFTPIGIMRFLYNFCIKRKCRKMKLDWSYKFKHADVAALKNQAVWFADVILAESTEVRNE